MVASPVRPARLAPRRPSSIARAWAQPESYVLPALGMAYGMAMSSALILASQGALDAAIACGVCAASVSSIVVAWLDQAER